MEPKKTGIEAKENDQHEEDHSSLSDSTSDCRTGENDCGRSRDGSLAGADEPGVVLSPKSSLDGTESGSCRSTSTSPDFENAVKELDFIHSLSSIGSVGTFTCNDDGTPTSGDEDDENQDTVRNIDNLMRNSISTTNLRTTVVGGSHRSIYTSIVLMPETGTKWNQLAERDTKMSKFCVIPVLEDQMCQKMQPVVDLDEQTESTSNESSLESNNPLRSLLARRAVAMQQIELSPVMEMPFGSAVDINQSLRDIRKAKSYGQVLPDKANLRRNFLLQCLSFFFVYSGYIPIRGIQTSLNHHQNLGSISVSVIFASCVFGSIMCPILVQRYGAKRTLCVSHLGFLVYAFGNLYASFYTLIPASIVFGLCFSCVLGAQGAYQTNVAAAYSSVTQTKIEKVLPFFGGIYFTFLQSANLFGNGLASTVLRILGPLIDPDFYHIGPNMTTINTNTTSTSTSISSSTTNTSISMNDIAGIVDDEPNNCGALFDNVFVNSNKFLVSPKAMYTLLGIMIACILTSIVICTFFVERLDCIFKRRNKSLLSHVKTVFSYHRDFKTWLLLCLATYASFGPSFVYGDVVKAFVTCPIGLDMIGYAVVCYATGSALMAASSGHIAKLIGPQVLQGLGFALSASLYTTMLLWQPDKERPYLIFVLFAFIGMNDAIYQTKYYSMVGILFAGKTESAFSFFLMYQSTVVALVFALSPLLAMTVKLYLASAFLCTTVVAYTLLTLKLKREQLLEQEIDNV